MWGSRFCSVFRLHSSRYGRFCGNPLPSFGVFPVLKVAPLWVSALHLHTSLSACNRDVSLSIPLLRLRNGDIPNLMLKSFRINHCMRIFMHDFLMVFTGGVSCLNFNAIARYMGSDSSHDLSRGPSAKTIVKGHSCTETSSRFSQSVLIRQLQLSYLVPDQFLSHVL